MSGQYNTTGFKGFTSGEAIPQYSRVKLSAGAVVVAGTGASDPEWIGWATESVFASGKPIAIRLRNAPGSYPSIAAGAVAAGALVYGAAAGKVDDAASGSAFGVAGEAATNAGDIIEIIPQHTNATASVATGTTNADFTVDSDATTPKIALAGQTGGTGDYTTTLKPETTLSGNNAIIVPEANGDTLVAVALAQTLTNKTLSTGCLDLVPAQSLTAAADSGAGSSITAGVRKVTVAGVATNSDDWIVLPAIESLAIGDSITIACNAGSNFELRTVASSNTKINDQDSDGTKEYLCTDTDVVVVTKRTTTDYIAVSYTKLGAVRTAVVPD